MKLTVNSIKLIENFLSVEEYEYVDKHLSGAVWKFGHSSLGDDPNKLSHKWFDCRVDDISYFNDYLLKKINKITKQEWIADSIYANGQLIHADGSWHNDRSGTYGEDDNEYYTFMIYITPISKLNVDAINGHTEFKVNDEIISIEPFGNRAVIFDSFIMHRGRAPTVPNLFRKTLVWKLIKKK
jgi:hypothetical protein